MRTALRIGLPLFVVLAVSALVLSACDSTNILAMLTTEVKKSTGKLLVVNSVSPQHTSTNVNPGARMTVTFDRALDMSTVNGTTVTISPIPTALEAPGFHLDFSYNNGTQTLYVDTDPWLGDSTDYTLTVTTGVRGVDGSEPEKNYSWSFQTGISPKGILKIEADAAFTNRKGPGQPLRFDIDTNESGYWYAVASSEAAFQTPASLTWSLLTSDPSLGNSAVAYYFDAAAVDGPQTVYYQFKVVGAPTVYSAIRSDTITLDASPPTITVSTPTVYHNIAALAYPLVSAYDGATGSGVNATTWSWTNKANPVTISPINAQAPSLNVTGAQNTSYQVGVTVSDNLGNTSTEATVNVIKDTVAPDAVPTFTVIPASPTLSPVPRWDWTLNSTTGGESTRICTYSVTNSVGTVFYSRPSTSALYYYPKTDRWPYYYEYGGMPPETYTMTVRERDAAGNTSSAAASTIKVTAVLPVDGAKNVPLVTTLQWRTMFYRDRLPRYYQIHWGYLDRGNFIEEGRTEVAQPEPGDPSSAVTLKRSGQVYVWYAAGDTGQRSPPRDGEYWSFTTVFKF